MLPHTFKGSNFTYKKPEGWTDEECMDLPVARCLFATERPGMVEPTVISFWKFSKEDLEEIARTGGIYCSVSQGFVPKEIAERKDFPWMQPPVSLFTESLWGE